MGSFIFRAVKQLKISCSWIIRALANPQKKKYKIQAFVQEAKMSEMIMKGYMKIWLTLAKLL